MILPVDETLHNRTLGLTEPLSSVPPGRVGDELSELVLGGDVVLERHIRHLDILAAPLPEELDLGERGLQWKRHARAEGLASRIQIAHVPRALLAVPRAEGRTAGSDDRLEGDAGTGLARLRWQRGQRGQRP